VSDDQPAQCALTPAQAETVLEALAVRLRATAAEILQAPGPAALAGLPDFIAKLARLQDVVAVLSSAASRAAAPGCAPAESSVC
jgi:hypothetical protein